MIIVRAIIAKEKPEEFSCDLKDCTIIFYDYEKHTDIAWADVTGPDIEKRINVLRGWYQGFIRTMRYFNIEHEFIDLCFGDENWKNGEHCKMLLEEELYG